MKENIIQNINAVINALNNVTVCGKQNLYNLSGSISILEDIVSYIERECKITSNTEDNE